VGASRPSGHLSIWRATMSYSKYSDPEVFAAALLQDWGATSGESAELLADESLSLEEFLCRFAEQVGMRSQDLFLIAGMGKLDDVLFFNEEAGRELPRLVRRVLRLSTSNRRHLCEFVQHLPRLPRPVSFRKPRPYERYPPGFGSLLVRMLALRNLGWSSAAQVMYLMSGVRLSPSAIGAVGRGTRKIDVELLHGFAAVLGAPVAVLKSFTGAQQVAESDWCLKKNADIAALLWDVRNLTAKQIQEVCQLAEELVQG